MAKVEVQTTSQWAAAHKKPMYVLPTNDSADSLFKITTCKKVEVAYISFPISHIRNDPESQQKIDQFVTELRRFKDLAIISPRALMLPENPSRDRKPIHSHARFGMVCRKIHGEDFCVLPEKVYSRGVDHESIRAKESCKDVWFIAPPEMDDPSSPTAPSISDFTVRKNVLKRCWKAVWNGSHRMWVGA